MKTHAVAPGLREGFNVQDGMEHDADERVTRDLTGSRIAATREAGSFSQVAARLAEQVSFFHCVSGRGHDTSVSNTRPPVFVAC